MKTGISLAIGLMVLAACVPATPTATLVSITPAAITCDTAGIVNSESITTAQGLDYPYMIYLPPCYQSDGSRLYPILYLIPGRGGGPGTWFAANVAEIADELILSRQVAPFIIVSTQSIDNSPTPTAITDDLVPSLENLYPISPDRRHHEVAGGSLGGIAAYRVGFSNPDHFSSVGMFGSGLTHGEEDQIRKWLGAMTADNKPLVFLNSGWDDPLMVDSAYDMLALLAEYDIPYKHVFTKGAHVYSYWAMYLPDYIQWAAQDW
jgi:enterochelin esterase family protein